MDFCEKMANEGKTVIVAALDGTFQRKVKTSDPGLTGDSIQVLPRSSVFRIEAIGWWVL